MWNGRMEDGWKRMMEGQPQSWNTKTTNTQSQGVSKSTVINPRRLPTHTHKQQTLSHEDIGVITLPSDGMWKLRKQSAFCLWTNHANTHTPTKPHKHSARRFASSGSCECVFVWDLDCCCFTRIRKEDEDFVCFLYLWVFVWLFPQLRNRHAVMTALTGDQTARIPACHLHLCVCVAECVCVCWQTPLCAHLLAPRLKQWAFEWGEKGRESKQPNHFSLLFWCVSYSLL